MLELIAAPEFKMSRAGPFDTKPLSTFDAQTIRQWTEIFDLAISRVTLMRKIATAFVFFVASGFAAADEFNALVHSTSEWDPQVMDCVKRQNGGIIERGECQAKLVSKLKREQQIIIGQIRKFLAKPDRNHTNYRAAANGLTVAQANWEKFVRADCGIIGDVFGQGTDLGPTGEACFVDHYKLRNAQLRFLQRDYLNDR